MILTTTCDQYEYDAITRRAAELGIKVTAAPGFIYLKGNWIVGNTVDDEAYFNSKIPSKSLTPTEFLAALKRDGSMKASLAIICDNEEQRDKVIDHFIWYKLWDESTPSGLVVFIIPSEHALMLRDKETARENAKEGYQVIDFEVFKTIVG